MPFCGHCGSATTETSFKLCASCGNPNNGAPRPALSTGGTNAAGIVIAVVATVLVMAAIIGILAAIAIPNLLTAMQRSRQKRTMADVLSLATAVEAYATDTNEYPKGETADDLRAVLTPTYMKSVPVKDGWESSIRYECWGEEDSPEVCSNYAFGSGGRNKAFEKSLLRDYKTEETKDFDGDIVYSNGEFVSYPEGTAR